MVSDAVMMNRVPKRGAEMRGNYEKRLQSTRREFSKNFFRSKRNF